VKKALFASVIMAGLLISATAVMSDDEVPHHPSLQYLLN
jgi:hypothetical protein